MINKINALLLIIYSKSYKIHLFSTLLLASLFFFMIYMIINKPQQNIYLQKEYNLILTKTRFIKQYQLALAYSNLSYYKINQTKAQLAKMFLSYQDLTDLTFKINSFAANNFLQVLILKPDNIITAADNTTTQTIELRLMGGYLNFINFIIELEKIEKIINYLNIKLLRIDNNIIDCDIFFKIYYE